MRSLFRTRRRIALVLGALAVVLVAAVAVVVVLSSRPGDVSHPDVEFNPNQRQADNPQAAAPDEGASAFDWPVYGYTKARTHYLPLRRDLRPPFRYRWKVGGRVQLEFPPVMGQRSLYLLKNNGALYGITRATGKVRWKRKLGYLAASSPAYAHNTVYALVLARGKGVKGGRIVAVSAKDGHTRWSRPLPSRSESSPLIDRGTLYFGSEDGTVYALRARDGFTRWRHKVGGAVKAGLALDGGRLFFGDYDGKVHALRASDGHELWRTGTSGSRFGLSSGDFYSTPAAAYGRVYVGNTDGFVYSFAQQSGKLAWRKQTGGYVYSSPAVASVPGGSPTVYIGSYDRKFYALDARSGRVRWRANAGGKISGGPVVLGDLVFFSTLNRTTTALGARTGQKVWFTHRGQFNPVVSNGRGLFLVGATTLYGYDAQPPPATSAERSAVAERRHRREVGRRVTRRRRALARRVAARRRKVARRNRLVRRHARVCKGNGRHRRCRPLHSLVCVRHGAHGATVCRTRAHSPNQKPRSG